MQKLSNEDMEKSEILKILIEQKFFAPSTTQLAQELGITGKMVFNRIIAGTAKARAIDNLWSQLVYNYGLTEDIMYLLPDMLALSDRMAKDVSIDEFAGLAKCRYSSLLQPIPERLHAIYQQNILAYCYTIVIFYMKTKGYDPTVDKHSETLTEVMQQIDSLLFRIYPEMTIAHRIATDSIVQGRTMNIRGWCSVMIHIGRVVCYYTHPVYMEQIGNMVYQALPFEKSSWWIENNENIDETIIWLLEQMEDGMGVYNVLQIKAKSGEKISKENCKYQRWGFIGVYDLLRIVVPSGNQLKKSSYYSYHVDDNDGIIQTEFLPQMSVENAIRIPQSLIKVPNNSIWMKWINEQDKNEIYDIFSRLALDAIKLASTNYSIVDIIQSRHHVTICMRKGSDPIERVALSYDRYISLKQISVWDKVTIYRGIADGIIYAYWNETNICIPLK